jgi:O-antigen/teichoic acid export membrane protein
VLLAFADAGFGNSLVNVVAGAVARGDRAEAQRYISTAYVVLGLLALVIVGIYLAVRVYIPWATILALGPDPVMRAAVDSAMVAFIVCFALSIPAGVAYRVQQALQVGYAASLWQLFGSLVSLIALLIVIAAKGSLMQLVVASAGVPVVIGLFNAATLWRGSRSGERPSVRLATPDRARHLAKSGFLFLTLQLAGSVAYASDNIIIAHVLGQQAVAQYSVCAKLFEGLLAIIAVFVAPLWPAYAEAAARGDRAWVRQTLLRSLAITAALVTAVVIGMIGVGKLLMLVWVGHALVYSLPLFLAYGAWAILKSLGNALAAFLNGLGQLRSQAALAVLFAAASVFAKIYCAGQIGLPGIPLALVLCYAPLMILPFALRLPRILARI